MSTHRLPKHRRPVHPGEILEEEFRKELGWTQRDMATKLGISLVRYSEIANGKRGITADTALRIARVFGTTPQLWMNLQADVDLWDASQKLAEALKSLKPMPRPKVPEVATA